ncbi:unnamed protein product [Gongylonema pulchrum]|uniref:Phospholipid-transporting ATPase IIB n=1 Tax=Gongylonema pulchrum TaxID=637853 RepID=A0A183E199_9BILA|nr:unnamed protein product [Gongylonema pulchrum]
MATQWKNVKVGDILRVESDQMFPADMVLLSSSEPQAMAYIETSNLDGETNLKIRQGLECTSHLTEMHAIAEFHCMSQLLLRGARLKHTRWICGAVLYTGHDAKSNIDSITNQRILFLFFILITLAVVSAFGAYLYDHRKLIHAYYLGFKGAFHFCSFWLPFKKRTELQDYQQAVHRAMQKRWSAQLEKLVAA